MPTLPIGPTLKRLRRARDMSQEQLAVYLSVTPQAISRWETGAALPDIAQLPALAHIFDVTTDELLGVDLTAKEARIQAITANAWDNYSAKGHLHQAVDLLRGALLEYPNSHTLIAALCFAVWWTRHAPRQPHEDQATHYKATLEEAIALGEKVLAECTQDEPRHQVIQVLCYCYPNLGQTDKAVALALQMPDASISRNALLCRIHRGTQRYTQYQWEIYSTMDTLLNNMTCINAPLDNGNNPYTPAEFAAIQQKVIDLYALFIEDGQYGFFHTRLASAHMALAHYHAQKKDPTAALGHLQHAATHAIAFDTVQSTAAPDATYTALLFRGHPMGAQQWSKDSPKNTAQAVLDDMQHADFAPLRSHAAFSAIENELRPHAVMRTPPGA